VKQDAAHSGGAAADKAESFIKLVFKDEHSAMP
jgi:hypothetical protein